MKNYVLLILAISVCLLACCIGEPRGKYSENHQVRCDETGCHNKHLVGDEF